MYRPLTDRSTNIVVYGMDINNFSEWSSDLKQSLEGFHMAWSVDSRVSEVLEPLDENVEIIYFCNEKGASREVLLTEAGLLAKILKEHPYKPWVVIHSDLEYLFEVFANEDLIIAERGMVIAINERWNDQALQEAA